MRSFQKNQIHRLLLSCIYALGMLGIVASGGGSGGGSGDVTISAVTIEQPESGSSSFESAISVKGFFDYTIKRDASETVNISWLNNSTGESGFEKREFREGTYCVILLPPIPICTEYTRDNRFSFDVSLAMGANDISITVSSGESEAEASVLVLRMDGKPDAPTGVSVEATTDGTAAVVSWNPVSRANSYNIYYASSPGVTKSNYATLPDGNKIMNASSPEIISGLTSGITYYFVVTAVNSYGEGTESSEFTMLAAPTGVSVDETTNDSAVISWNPVTGATSYNIYYASSPGVTKSNYQTLPDGNKIANATSPQSITGLAFGIDYYLVVTAENTFGESRESAEVLAHTGPTLSFDIKTFRFDWTDEPNATHYRLLENPDGISGFSQVGSDIPQGTETYDHIVPLYKRMNASYILQSCDGVDCTDLSLFNITDNLVDAIGYFKASNTGLYDLFGGSISLSGDGSTLAIGATEDSNATGIDGDQANNSANASGAVYVFSRIGTTWNQQAYIKASNTESSDIFGGSISLSDDGNTLAVGAPDEDSNATGIDGDQANNDARNSGAVYVFSRSGITWGQQAYIKASNTESGDGFSLVSLSGDGNTLAVAAPFEDSSATGIDGDQANNDASNAGAVYVFSRSGTTWSQQAYIKASNTESGDGFSEVSLSGDGNTLAVGAGGEDSSATGIDGDQANNDASNAGAVYVFSRSGTTWSQQAYIKASNTVSDDGFGWVSLSTDGNTLAVGAGGEDSSATGIDSDQANNDASNAGAVYVFSRSGTTWGQQAYVKASNTESGDGFSEVSLSGDGNTLAVAARFEDSNATGIDGDQTVNSAELSGAVYLY